jgi:Ser/Thr protein kinase RdoA (MazF antagonist)
MRAVRGPDDMAKGRAHFSNHELAVVLSHYDIGIIQQLKSLSAGNPEAPKTIIVSDRGLFIVKRRPHGKDDPYRVSLAHAVREHLLAKGYPVAATIHTRDHGNSFLKSNDHIYELFEYVRGCRYDGSAEGTEDAGKRLAEFHKYLSSFTSEYRPILKSFHDSETVRRHLRSIGPCHGTGSPVADLQKISEELQQVYDAAAGRVNAGGLGKWPDKFTHGDWHPGNLMFEGHKVRVVLDFDSIKLAPTPTDLANGLLQFSIVGGKADPTEWPDRLDLEKVASFGRGYRGAVEMGDCGKFLPDLMIETMIAEAVMPVAATGSFGHMGGLEFLRMIRRKAAWVEGNRETLMAAVRS